MNGWEQTGVTILANGALIGILSKVIFGILNSRIKALYKVIENQSKELKKARKFERRLFRELIRHAKKKKV